MLLSKASLISSFIVLSGLFASSAHANKAAELFKLCTACHGDNGEGKESLLTPAIAGMEVWYVKRQLENYKNDARGKHPKDLAGLRMRPMARTIDSQEKLDILAEYVSKLPQQPTKVTIKGDVVNGQASYAVCSACHGVDGKGQEVLNAPSLLIQNDWYLVTQLKNFKEGVRGADAAKDPHGASMAGMAMTLTDESMKDVVYYIQTLREKGKK